MIKNYKSLKASSSSNLSKENREDTPFEFYKVSLHSYDRSTGERLDDKVVSFRKKDLTYFIDDTKKTLENLKSDLDDAEELLSDVNSL